MIVGGIDVIDHCFRRDLVERLISGPQAQYLRCGPRCQQVWQLRNPRERPALF